MSVYIVRSLATSNNNGNSVARQVTTVSTATHNNNNPFLHPSIHPSVPFIIARRPPASDIVVVVIVVLNVSTCPMRLREKSSLYEWHGQDGGHEQAHNRQSRMRCTVATPALLIVQELVPQAGRRCRGNIEKGRNIAER